MALKQPKAGLAYVATQVAATRRRATDLKDGKDGIDSRAILYDLSNLILGDEEIHDLAPNDCRRAVS